MGVFDNIRKAAATSSEKLTPAEYLEASQQASQTGRAFTPGTPLLPRDGYNSTPRSLDYFTGYNIAQRPRIRERVSFSTLKGIIESYDIAQIAISHRIDSIRSLEWFVEPLGIAQGTDTTDIVAKANKILSKPDHDLPFSSWVYKYCYDILAYDAGSLFKIRNNAGQVIGLRVIDGTTIAPLIDYYGNRPSAPAPAFVQFAQGLPWDWLSKDDLIYVPFRPIPNSPYGRAPMESILLNANTDLLIQSYFLQRFTEGTIPQGFATSPDGWTPDQIKEFQEAWDAVMYGDTSKKHQIMWTPNGTNFTWSNEHDYNSDLSMFLMRKTAAAFHVTPNDLGWTEDVNRANGETQVDVQFRTGDLPLIQHIQNILSDFLQHDLGLPLRFVFNTGKEREDRVEIANAMKTYVEFGVLSPSEVRQNIFGLQETDNTPVPRFIMTKNGPMALEGLFTSISGKVDPVTAGYVPDSIPAAEDGVDTTIVDVSVATTNLDAEGNGETKTESYKIDEETDKLEKEATAGITADTGIQGNPLMGAEPVAKCLNCDLPENECKCEVSTEDLAKAELNTFKRFVKARAKTGEWRDFKFENTPADIADSLNRAARESFGATDTPKGHGQSSLEKSNEPEVALLVVRAASTGRILVIQRELDYDDPESGKLDLPGGHIEEGETYLDAAVREFNEEVGTILPSGTMRDGWMSTNGYAIGYIYETAEEYITPRKTRNPEFVNPDDEGKVEGSTSDSILWVYPSELIGNPMLKTVLHNDIELIIEALDFDPIYKSWKDSSNKVPQHDYDIELTDFYTPIVAKALKEILASLDITSLIEDLQGGVAKARDEELLARIMLKLKNKTGLALTSITNAIASMRKDGYLAGLIGAMRQIGKGVKPVDSTIGRAIFGIDWDTWKPGMADAAAKVAEGGLANMLSNANITVKDIEDTVLNNIGNKIADGLSQGLPSSVIADNIENDVGSQFRAERIAYTETARAMSLASADVYQANGVGEYDLVLSDGACDECESVAEDGPYSVDDMDNYPPIHPFCRCAATPVVESVNAEDVTFLDEGDIEE
jgi:SPP1 gp7 family putative phage head morphogenesis protein